MQCEFTVIVNNSMTGVAATLKTDDNVGTSSFHIGNFTFALVAPICADNCFNNRELSPPRRYGILTNCPAAEFGQYLTTLI